MCSEWFEKLNKSMDAVVLATDREPEFCKKQTVKNRIREWNVEMKLTWQNKKGRIYTFGNMAWISNTDDWWDWWAQKEWHLKTFYKN